VQQLYSTWILVLVPDTEFAPLGPQALDQGHHRYRGKANAADQDGGFRLSYLLKKRPSSTLQLSSHGVTYTRWQDAVKA
jgi:hypothetical protein